jgi:hypothetical protein
LYSRKDTALSFQSILNLRIGLREIPREPQKISGAKIRLRAAWFDFIRFVFPRIFSTPARSTRASTVHTHVGFARMPPPASQSIEIASLITLSLSLSLSIS